LGHFLGMQEQNPSRKLTIHTPEATQRVRRPAVRWLDSVEDLRAMGIRNWRRKSQERYQWRAIVKEAEVHRGL
jgi:ribosome recycling factor